MNVVSIQNENDVIGFIYNRPNRLTMDLPNGGLASIENVPLLLEKGKYIEILKKVWMEPNQLQLLKWLRAQPQIHAPLLAERAIAEFNFSSTEKTIIRLALPLIKAAQFRTMQDAEGVNDISLQGASNDLTDVYLQELSTICEQRLRKNIGDIISQNHELLTNSVDKIVNEVAKLTLTEKLPSSEWVATHGLNAFSENTQLYSNEEAHQNKIKFAKNFIKDRRVTLPENSKSSAQRNWFSICAIL